ncbi:MAG: hypothetical protein K2P58_15815 [Hyphomonadaceae bacterium]|nr:hypothetical protein [Hyphomonadaceae bacterium]
MTKTILAGLVALLLVVLAWFVSDEIITIPTPDGGRMGLAPPRLVLGELRPPYGPAPVNERVDEATAAAFERRVLSERLWGADPSAIVNSRNWRDLSQACVNALSRRASQIEGDVYATLHASPRMPTLADDTCRANAHEHLIGTDANVFARAPRIRARQVRTLSQPTAGWLTEDVKAACGPWMEPRRLNLEPGPDGNYGRLWCG